MVKFLFRVKKVRSMIARIFCVSLNGHEDNFLMVGCTVGQVFRLSVRCHLCLCFLWLLLH